jgi:N-acetylmuramoyl-L-alanine amidase
MLWLGGAWAQPHCQEHNHLAVNNVLVEQRPCYFVAHGDNANAYITAPELARAVGASFHAEDARLLFERQGYSVALALTGDISQGLKRQAGSLVVNGEARESLQGIHAGDEYYVPIGPIAAALGVSVEWDGTARIIYIDYSEASSAQPVAAAPQRIANPPRVGANHDQGFTRVVLDLPSGVHHSVFVGEAQLLVTLSEVGAEPYGKAGDDPYLKNLELFPIDGGAALRLEVHHPVSASGEGFRIGLLPADGNHPHERLFVDLGPEQQAKDIPLLSLDARPQEVARVAPPRSNGYTVVIDAGHGGQDGGAMGQVAGWNEAQVVLAISLKLRDILRQNGVEVIMTREGNTYPELVDRANMANTERNLFVSVHANGHADRGARGVETFIFGQPIDDAALQAAIRENAGVEGREVGVMRTQEALLAADSIAGNILRQEQLSLSRDLAVIVQRALVGATNAPDRGVKSGPFMVLRHARIPAILVEVGFMTNPEEGRELATTAYQLKLAEALASGILEFLERGGQLVAREP